MNLDQLKKNIGLQVQLEPVAISLDERDRPLPAINDDWLICNVTDDGAQVRNVRTHHETLLARDHIHHFTSNPNRSIAGGAQYGFFTLLVQIYLKGNTLSIRPCVRPGEPVLPHPIEHEQKWVDSKYPSDSGLQARLEGMGYRLAWCGESKLARRVELEGWEVVAENGPNGVPTTFHVKTNPENQVLIKNARPKS